MKNPFIDSHKRYLRKLNSGIIAALCLFIGGLAFSFSNLAAAPDTNQIQNEKTVKGLIISPDKKAIPGAVIIVKGSNSGTVTDINGNFIMDLQKFKEGSVTLEISMIDYEPSEIVVKTNKLPKDLGKITLKKEAE